MPFRPQRDQGCTGVFNLLVSQLALSQTPRRPKWGGIGYHRLADRPLQVIFQPEYWLEAGSGSPGWALCCLWMILQSKQNGLRTCVKKRLAAVPELLKFRPMFPGFSHPYMNLFLSWQSPIFYFTTAMPKNSTLRKLLPVNKGSKRYNQS